MQTEVFTYLDGLHDNDQTGERAPPVLSILLRSSPLYKNKTPVFLNTLSCEVFF